MRRIQTIQIFYYEDCFLPLFFLFLDFFSYYVCYYIILQ